MTGKDIDTNLNELRGFNYIFGYKFSNNPVRESILKVLRAQNSSVFTQAYYDKAIKLIGKKAIDCSGLVCHAFGLSDIGSWNIEELPDRYPAKWMRLKDMKTAQPYDILWKPGHVAMVNGAGEVVEAKGIDYGVVKNMTQPTAFKEIIRPLFIKEVDYENLGWNWDGVGWWYATGHKKGQYYKGGIYHIDGADYVFNDEGYACEEFTLKCSPHGVLYKKEYKLCGK